MLLKEEREALRGLLLRSSLQTELVLFPGSQRHRGARPLVGWPPVALPSMPPIALWTVAFKGVYI